MTLYLLDENVLRELKHGGHENVHRWIATVDDTDLRLSVATLFEKRRVIHPVMAASSSYIWPPIVPRRDARIA